MTPAVQEKLNKIQNILQDCSPVIVAFSGGSDSAFLLKLCMNFLMPSEVLAVTGISPSIPLEEQKEAEKIAEELHAPYLTIHTDEMEKEEYRTNPFNRCYFCKEELFSKLEKLRINQGYKTILDGTNADDIKDYRPGLKAREKFNVRSPLLESGFTKDEIRVLSREWNLQTWDKPAMPCLSSRVPYGQEITLERLNRIYRAEKLLRKSGFQEVRVRDHFPIARIEVQKEKMSEILEEPLHSKIIEEFKKLGYTYITLDLSGFKSGSLNHLINNSGNHQFTTH